MELALEGIKLYLHPSIDCSRRGEYWANVRVAREWQERERGGALCQ